MQTGCNVQARFEPVFMKTITGPRATKIGMLLALQRGNVGLRFYSCQVKHRVGVIKYAVNMVRVNFL